MYAASSNKITYYVPRQCLGYFSTKDYIIQKNIHKIFPARTNGAAIWHTTSQGSAYMTNNKNIKNVLTVHDLNFLYERKSFSKIKNYLKAVQHNIDKADSIVTISEFTKSDVLKHLETRNKPVSVIYNGCCVMEFPAYDTPTYRPVRPFLFSIGTVLPKKNFHVLHFLLRNNDYELIISGKGNGDYTKRIIDEAKKARVEHRVKLTGAINAEDKYWYLKNCAAFLFPSLAEGFGIPPVEAMHFGKPVFLSTSTSLPEIGGQQAYYFNDFDPENMRKIFEDGMNHYVQTSPATSIIRHANQFDWGKSAQAYWKVYDSLS
jgi:glycosyltransferase involved in cell wall biosynthesis